MSSENSASPIKYSVTLTVTTSPDLAVHAVGSSFRIIDAGHVPGFCYLSCQLCLLTSSLDPSLATPSEPLPRHQPPHVMHDHRADRPDSIYRQGQFLEYAMLPVASLLSSLLAVMN